MFRKLLIATALGLGALSVAGTAHMPLISTEAHAFSLKKAAKKAGKAVKKGVESVGGEAIELGEAAVDAHKKVYKKVYVDPVVEGARVAGKAGHAVAEGAGSIGGEALELGRAVADAHVDIYEKVYVDPAVKLGKAAGKTARCAVKGGCGRTGPAQRSRMRDHRN